MKASHLENYALKLKEMSVYESVEGEPLDESLSEHRNTTLIDWVSALKGGMRMPRDFFHFAKHEVSDVHWDLKIMAEGRKMSNRDKLEDWVTGNYSEYSEVAVEPHRKIKTTGTVRVYYSQSTGKVKAQHIDGPWQHSNEEMRIAISAEMDEDTGLLTVKADMVYLPGANLNNIGVGDLVEVAWDPGVAAGARAHVTEDFTMRFKMVHYMPLLDPATGGSRQALDPGDYPPPYDPVPC